MKPGRRGATAIATPEGFSGLYRVLTGEDAKTMGQEIARAAGRPEAQSAIRRPGRTQPSDRPSTSPRRGELSGS
ncbi:hypothetical protein [Brevibacterium sp. HMSC063G07]|uniref:hypothetical protein n=1 Tax=Brevibacterium sp. HMSC063G07 TaxID=1739261 RepID=UPI00114CC25C|nr:hypothetical protein [Brevibacterium sp. HMSC063G07]